MLCIKGQEGKIQDRNGQAQAKEVGIRQQGPEHFLLSCRQKRRCSEREGVSSSGR